MDVRSAELTKYAANAMLATKISFMNEMANLAERLGADIEEVRKGIGADPRIGYHFIYPGCGYGGSCFPKDVKALAHAAERVGYTARLLQSVEAINETQKTTLFSKLALHFGSKALLRGKTIAVWGLAFKPNTDDIREAPAVQLIQALVIGGARVRVYDPVVKGINADLDSQITFCEDSYAAARDADLLILVTEWKIFRSPDYPLLKKLMKKQNLIDGRNIWNRDDTEMHGFTYLGIGR
jgi:UDPglucose 6-dehydrogenase